MVSAEWMIGVESTISGSRHMVDWALFSNQAEATAQAQAASGPNNNYVVEPVTVITYTPLENS